MNLQSTIEIYAGGPGSGCNPEKGKCGRTSEGTSLKAQKIARQFKAEVMRQGYDSDKVEIVKEGEGFNYDPVFGQALASTNSKTGVIQLAPELWTVEQMKGIVAHELMHLRMSKFIREKYSELPDRDAILSMATDGGITPYSASNWKAVYSGEKPFTSGFQETLAEMARVEADTGRVVGSPEWKNLYAKVMSHGAKLS